MKWLQIVLVLIFCTVVRAQHVAQIKSRSFYHPEHGVKQLIQSLESEQPGFFTLDPMKRDAEFDRIASGCFNDTKHKEDQVCRVINRIATALERFAKDREIVLLFDLHYGNVSTLYGRFDIAEAEDITQVFVDEYNRLHP